MRWNRAASAFFALASAVSVAGVSPPAAREVLPFIADDYPRALAEARARKLPIFVEAWAPW
ncbi:MAG TPA: hypothetical protein VLO07_07790 [Thermoanaerobaculia bacterium]|nr:hypothetical protein [Thermoanaerobaculia bacterium]